MNTVAPASRPLLRGARAELGSLRRDLPASIVVFLVALPLCLGIALASGAPLVAGLVSGVVGGLAVPIVSGAALAVSGPAAGLTSIVAAGVAQHGYGKFLAAVVLAGLLQISLGLLRAGFLAYYVPSSVIRGLLAGIGAIILFNQLPHAVGLDMGQRAGEPWSTLAAHVRPGAALIAGVGLLVLVLWERLPAARRPAFVPGPLLAVLLGVAVNAGLGRFAPEWALAGAELVRLPSVEVASLMAALPTPELLAPFAGGGPFGLDLDLLRTAAVLAAVASIETLLCIEAIDKLDPLKRTTPTSRELVAQGIGNTLSGLLGGLPITAVVVRGSANVQAGGKTWRSAMLHGLWLLVAVVSIPAALNLIPLAALAAVLLHVGYKLTPPRLFATMYRQGREPFTAFAATFLGVIATNLLAGVALGIAVSITQILWRNFQAPYFIHSRSDLPVDGVDTTRIVFAEHVSFWHKASVVRVLHEVPAGARLELDARQARYVDYDVLEVVARFQHEAPQRGIALALVGFQALPSTDASAH